MTEPRPRWRPEVVAFADEIESVLRRKDAQRGTCGWRGMALADLWVRIAEEAAELRSAIVGNDPGSFSRVAQHRIRREAADVANFAMMIHDNAGAYLDRCAPLRVRRPRGRKTRRSRATPST